MIPVFLEVLNLQLVPSLREKRLGVFLKAPREDSALPVADVDPAIGVYDSCRGKKRDGEGIEKGQRPPSVFHRHQRWALPAGWAKLAAHSQDHFSLPSPHLHTDLVLTWPPGEPVLMPKPASIPISATQVNFWAARETAVNLKGTKASTTAALGAGGHKELQPSQHQQPITLAYFHWDCTQDQTYHQEMPCPPHLFLHVLRTVNFNRGGSLIQSAAGHQHKDSGQQRGEGKQSGQDRFWWQCQPEALKELHPTRFRAFFFPMYRKAVNIYTFKLL